MRLAQCLVVLATMACSSTVSGWTETNSFAMLPLRCIPAPTEAVRITIPTKASPIQGAISPTGATALLLLAGEAGDNVPFQLLSFDIPTRSVTAVTPPLCDHLEAIAFHADGNAVFALGRRDEKSTLWRSDRPFGASWNTIYQTTEDLERLLVSPSKFALHQTPLRGPEKQHRIYMGVELESGIWGTRAVTEFGELPVNSLAPKQYHWKYIDSNFAFEVMDWLDILDIPWSKPDDFHPTDAALLWHDRNGTLFRAKYYDVWTSSAPVQPRRLQGGEVFYSPNGVYICRWRKNTPGLLLVGDDNSSLSLLNDTQFIVRPSWYPDGKAVAGVVDLEGNLTFVCLPVQVPLADVMNAWQFVTDNAKSQLFEKHGGVFGDTDYEQLYQFYDEELYNCNHFDSQIASRPYLVTTDIFWENFGAAYEGIFQLVERTCAIPAFWSFVELMKSELPSYQYDRGIRLGALFTALELVRTMDWNQSQLMEHLESQLAPTLELAFDKPVPVEELKPRGHYTRNEALGRYFVALKLLTLFQPDQNETVLLRNLPAAIHREADGFINPYSAFIAPSRYSIAIGTPEREQADALTSFPPESRLFPLSFGFDNLVLDSVVFHPSKPLEQQIVSKKGELRLLPNTLEFPAATGSSFAWQVLSESGILADFPALEPVLTDLRKRFKERQNPTLNIYEQWLTALGTQWSDQVDPPGPWVSRDHWNAKRLQSGLASWTTLRHATVLVNERTAAECGEAGFEAMLLPPPLGVVEPDPPTLGAIAGLFEQMSRVVTAVVPEAGQSMAGAKTGSTSTQVRSRVLKLLEDAKKDVLRHKDMAERQMKGEALLPQEYEDIYYTARTAEYHFLLFKSLSSDEMSLSQPDPQAKIVDIAGSPNLGRYVHAAIGNPAKWELIVPHWGRRQLVKGVVSTYRQVIESEILNDDDWRLRVKDAPPPDWIAPYYGK